jgi:hypothetical protein
MKIKCSWVKFIDNDVRNGDVGNDLAMMMLIMMLVMLFVMMMKMSSMTFCFIGIIGHKYIHLLVNISISLL